MPLLMDPAGRRMRKLRLSLTDACQMRCFYCLPQTPRFLPHRDLVPPRELLPMVERLVELGLDQIRITGGEPTVRPELMEVVRGLGALPLDRLGMTTNALRLEPLLPALWEAGLRSVNISLDSLSEEVYARITGGGSSGPVLRAARKARDMGFEVKLNAVLFRGLNHGEAVDFLRFAESESIPVRFLELMRIGPAHREQRGFFISASEVIQALRDAGEKLRPLPGPPDATAFEYATEGGGRVGFIASESQPFCAGCSRLRLSATGFLRGCLMQENGLPLRGLPLSSYPSALNEVMSRKPLHRLPHTEQLMNRIGG